MKHIAIIGAGLTGASLAYRLSQTGARVTVIDAATPAAAASGASFGWINASFFHSPAHFNLRQAAIAAHHRLDQALHGSGAHWQGCLWWEEEAALETHAETLTALGYPLLLLTRRQIAAREPRLAAPARALFFPDEGAVDAARLTHRLLAASGAQVHTGTEVTRLVTGDRGITGLHTAQGNLAADHVILAAGTGCPALLAPLGLTLPMLPRPGLVLTTRPIGQRLSHILASPTQELRQDAQNRLIAPLAAAHQSDDCDSPIASPADLAQATLSRIRALLPGVDPDLDQIRHANRPVPGDGLPAVGPTGIMGLSLAVMHSGVTLAPLIAELLTAELATGTPSPLLAHFRPSRFFTPK